MFLTKLIVLNNKSCKDIQLNLSKYEPDVLIGVNDSGKTTILKSLDILFDEKKSLSFSREGQQKSDLSNTPLNSDEINNILLSNNYPVLPKYDGNIISIICQFELEKNDYENEEFQDSSKNNHLKWSINNDTVTIARIFHSNDSSGSGEENKGQNLSGYYLISPDFNNNGKYLELWNKNSKELQEIKKEFIVNQKEVDNKDLAGRFRNIENIEGIYNKIPKLESRWAKYESFSKDKDFFPKFKYLDWNFTLRDLEDLATEAMREVTSPLLQEIKTFVQDKQTQAVNGVNGKFQELIEGLKDELPSSIKKISSSVFFSVEQRITDIQLQKENVDGEVHIDNQGDGVKRQIWFALLKWRSKLPPSSTNKNSYVWCFDEPETHLYPSAQRQLFNTFREMCRNEFQVILSTHSTVFIDRTKIKNINKVVLKDGYSIINRSVDVDDIFNCLGLQNSDFLFFDKFLAVEGDTEYELIPILYKLKFGRSLIEDGIQMINLKGESNCRNNKQILESILSNFQKTDNKIYYLFDNDLGFQTQDNLFTAGVFDLEDSISNQIWIKFLKENCSIDVTDDILNNEIRAKLENQREKKFYKLLGNYVHDHLVDRYLPGKGTESGSLLTKCFSTSEEIPNCLSLLFEALNSIETVH